MKLRIRYLSSYASVFCGVQIQINVCLIRKGYLISYLNNIEVCLPSAFRFGQNHQTLNIALGAEEEYKAEQLVFKQLIERLCLCPSIDSLATWNTISLWCNRA